MTSYDGGKGGAGVTQWIINQIPPHRVFISAFLGNCAVMRAKRPALLNLGIEIDETVIAEYWRGVPGVTILPGDAIERLKRIDWSAETMLYLDPPYLLETRSCQRPLYHHEFSTIEQHRALLTLLRRLPCMIAISGYWSALYELELAGWRSSTFQTVKRSGEAATEWLWMNYPKPIELHDYRYLGRNFRERERIKRKKARWTQRLRAMDSLERLCLMEAIGELQSSIVRSGDSAGGIVRNGDVDERQAASSEAAMPAGTTRNGDASWPDAPDLTMLEQQL